MKYKILKLVLILLIISNYNNYINAQDDELNNNQNQNQNQLNENEVANNPPIKQDNSNTPTTISDTSNVNTAEQPPIDTKDNSLSNTSNQDISTPNITNLKPNEPISPENLSENIDSKPQDNTSNITTSNITTSNITTSNMANKDVAAISTPPNIYNASDSGNNIVSNPKNYNPRSDNSQNYNNQNPAVNPNEIRDKQLDYLNSLTKKLDKQIKELEDVRQTIKELEIIYKYKAMENNSNANPNIEQKKPIIEQINPKILDKSNDTQNNNSNANKNHTYFGVIFHNSDFNYDLLIDDEIFEENKKSNLKSLEINVAHYISKNFKLTGGVQISSGEIYNEFISEGALSAEEIPDDWRYGDNPTGTYYEEIIFKTSQPFAFTIGAEYDLIKTESFILFASVALNVIVTETNLDYIFDYKAYNGNIAFNLDDSSSGFDVDANVITPIEVGLGAQFKLNNKLFLLTSVKYTNETNIDSDLEFRDFEYITPIKHQLNIKDQTKFTVGFRWLVD